MMAFVWTAEPAANMSAPIDARSAKGELPLTISKASSESVIAAIVT